jgi:hypothetical protein
VIDLATLPIGSEHQFRCGDQTRTFKRVPGGWSDHRGVLWDDASMAAGGWVYVRACTD